MISFVSFIDQLKYHRMINSVRFFNEKFRRYLQVKKRFQIFIRVFIDNFPNILHGVLDREICKRLNHRKFREAFSEK